MELKSRSKSSEAERPVQVAVFAATKPAKSQKSSAATDPNAPLTEKQRLFVHYWASGESVDFAAKKAGFDSQSYGHQLKVMPKIRNLYDAEKAKYIEAAQVTREDVINGFKEAIADAKLMSEPATMIAGWREIGKLCGFYEPKRVDLNINMNGNVVLERMNKMSDAELLKIINEAEALGVDQEDV
jgi:hypothetical protein